VGRGGESPGKILSEGTDSTLLCISVNQSIVQLSSTDKSYSSSDSNRWAFRAHLKVSLLFWSFIKGERSFQIAGKAYKVVFLNVSVLG